MILFSYKDIVIAATVLNIIRNNKCSLEDAVALSPAFQDLPNLEAAIEFMARRAHVYTRLTAAEEMFSKILDIVPEDGNYFPEELPVFAAASPELAEHHEHFFKFWQSQTIHRGFHEFTDAVALMVDGQHYRTYPEPIRNGDFKCIGFPGAPDMLPGVDMLIKNYQSCEELLGFDPCQNTIVGCKAKCSTYLYCEFNPETRLLEPSVMFLSGRVYLNTRPSNKDELGGRFLQAVE